MSSQMTSSNDRTRTYWTPTMERYFIDLMLEQAHRGNRAGHTFNKEAWIEMLNAFNAKFGTQYDKDVLKSRYTNLWKQYNDVKTLLSQTGFSWDETQQMVVADEHVWTAYIKAYPDARPYKTKAVPNLNDLCLIYGYAVADGRYSRSSHDIDFEDEHDGENTGGRNGTITLANNECPRADWNPAMDQYFCELMLDQMGRGNKIGKTFTKQAWNDMLAMFNAKFGARYGKRVLRHRYKKLWKYYKDMVVILKQNDFMWDEMRQMILADGSIWDAYIKAHPQARAYRLKTLPNYNDLAIIFGNAFDEGISCHDKELENDSLVGKNDEGQGSQTFSGDRKRTYWTPPMDRYLIDLLVEQVHEGNKLGQTFITEAWIKMVTAFNSKFGSHYDKDVLKNRYKHLRRVYSDVTLLLEQRGFSWDETRDIVMAQDSVWDAYLKVHPGARCYRVKTIPNYHKLCFIFGEDASCRRYTRLAETTKLEPVIIITTEKESNDYFCDSFDAPIVEWTPLMDRYLIDLMVEQVNAGNKIGQTFTEQAWAHMVGSFNQRFGLQSDIYILENRYICLMKEHDDINNILNHPGFTWDESNKVITADDHTWEAHTKEQPDASTYKGKILGNYNDLHKISGNVFKEQFSCNHRVISTEGILEADTMCAKQERKRPNTTDLCPGQMNKAPRLSSSENSLTIGDAVSALQAVPEIDEDLLLDACDLLEDERKARTFLALDSPLRKKWLLRKLRPG